MFLELVFEALLIFLRVYSLDKQFLILSEEAKLIITLLEISFLYSLTK